MKIGSVLETASHYFLSNRWNKNMLHIVEAKHVHKKIVWVSFDDGSSGEVDLDGALKGPMFEPLEDENEFAKMYVDSELETITWPNGADLAPEFVRELLSEQAASVQSG